MMAQELENRVQKSSEELQKLREEIGKRIIGQSEMVDGILMALMAGGHVLLEGVPGLAKTLAVRTVAEVFDAGFKRLQFTPDLLPADLIGTLTYRQNSGEFVPRKGPIFTNIVLADEINRAPAKVQSALLEAMEERQVTIGDTSHPLPDPFFVLATQNPIEQEGTYPLPEAQLDRFVMKLLLDYPTDHEELEILRRMGKQQELPVRPILRPEHLLALRQTAEAVMIDERIEEYIVSIVAASRMKDSNPRSHSRFIDFGASPRGTLALYRCSKISALFEGRTFVIPDDVKSVAYPILRHRLVLSYEAEAEEMRADDVIRLLLKYVPVP
nr:MoxR family ATPase [Sediminispirochaeta bajacaliforniensis]